MTSDLSPLDPPPTPADDAMDVSLLSKVTRVTLVDHSPDGAGLVFEKWNLKEVALYWLDDGRTLKVFVR